MASTDSIWNAGIIFITFVLTIITISLLVYNFRATWLIRIWQRYQVWKAGVSEHLLKITDDLQISYLERKRENCDDEILLIVHGFAGNKENYCDFAGLIPKHFHVILVDLPGHGDHSKPNDEKGDYTIGNQVENLHKFVKAFGFGRKINMLGFSMGGCIVGIYAGKHGDMVSSIVLACPGGINSPKITQFIEKSRGNHEHNLLLPRNAKEMKEMLRLAIYHDVKISDHIAAALLKLREHRIPVHKKVFRDLIDNSQHFLLDSVLENIKVPVLCVWGEHDKILHVSGSEVIKKRIKNSEVHIVERCGHAISVDRPRKLLKITLEFLGKINTVNSTQ